MTELCRSSAGATVKACSSGTRLPTPKYPLLRCTNRTPTMDSTELHDRPLKKRRFFAEDSSPVPVRSLPQISTPPPVQPSFASPDLTVDGDDRNIFEFPSDGEVDSNKKDFDGFDYGLLQAVVGEVPPSLLDKLKRLSQNDVQRGEHSASLHLSDIC